MGKSTHAKRLVDRLNENGQKAKYVKYPVYTLEPSGPFINKILRGGVQHISEKELQLWFVVNRHQFEEEVEKWLKEGCIVIAEDYVGTGMAWGMAKGLSEQWLETINDGLRTEDLAILMTGDRVKSATEKGHVHEENDELIGKCYEKLQYLADKHGWKKIALQEKQEDTANMIWNLVNDEG